MMIRSRLPTEDGTCTIGTLVAWQVRRYIRLWCFFLYRPVPFVIRYFVIIRLKLGCEVTLQTRVKMLTP